MAIVNVSIDINQRCQRCRKPGVVKTSGLCMECYLGKRETRAAIIGVLDETDSWEHVAMGYISHVVHRPDISNRNMNRIAKKLNRAIGDVMALPKTWRKLG